MVKGSLILDQVEREAAKGVAGRFRTLIANYEKNK
jgi:hypothetical protein